MKLVCIVLFTFLFQGEPDRLTFQEEKELTELLTVALKAKPGVNALQLSDSSVKRQFDLASRVAQLGLLKMNQSIIEKKYTFNADFVGFYVSRFMKLFDEKALRDWVIAYAASNKTEKEFFTKMLRDTGLTGEKRDTVMYSYYTLPYPAERNFYMELVSIVYKNGTADFSKLNRRAKDWIANRNDLFP